MSTLTLVLIIIGCILLLGGAITAYLKYNKRTQTATEVVEEYSETHITSKAYSLETVLVFLNQDLENDGYNDAIADDESNNKSRKLQELKSSGIQECQLAIKRYEEKNIIIDSNITIATRDGYLDAVEKLKADKGKYLKDIDFVKKIQIDLENDIFDKPVFSTYIKGFDKCKTAKLQASV